jgi:predicted HicB family RNase H-like nuclease
VSNTINTLNVDPEQYGITVRGFEADGELMYSAKVAELPDLEEFSDTAEEARAIAIDSIKTLASMAQEQGVSFPLPFSYKSESYSGRLTLRVSRTLHQRIAEYARRNDVTLNAAMNELLTNGLGAASRETRAIVSKVDSCVILIDRLYTIRPDAASSPVPSYRLGSAEKVRRIVDLISTGRVGAIEVRSQLVGAEDG